MEEKTINEKESLELISQMIQQTKKESAIGSGNIFLVWGYLCVIISLAVFFVSYYRSENWGFLYLALPVIGFILSTIVGRRTKKKQNNAPSTYTSKNINAVWGCVSGVFAAYAVMCIFHWDTQSIWSGMFLLGLLLPGIGTYTTGVILKEWSLQLCGLIGTFIGLGFLRDLCCEGAAISIEWPLMMALTHLITLVIPGHALNYQARKSNTCKN